MSFTVRDPTYAIDLGYILAFPFISRPDNLFIIYNLLLVFAVSTVFILCARAVILLGVDDNYPILNFWFFIAMF